MTKRYTTADGFQDPLEGTYDDVPELCVPDKCDLTPEMYARLRQGFIEDGYLVDVR